MVEDRPIMSARKSCPKNIVLRNVRLMAIFAEISENVCINKGYLHEVLSLSVLVDVVHQT